MSTTTSKPYDWIRKIPSSLLQWDEIPLFGSPPEFQPETYQAELRDLFELEDLTLSFSPFEWKEKEKISSSLGEELLKLKFTVPSLEDYAYWIMPKQEAKELLSLLLKKKTDGLELLDPDFEEGFYRFMAMESISLLPKAGFDPALSPQLQPKAELPESDMLCMDVTLQLAEKSLHGRVLLSPQFRKSFKKKYEKKDPQAAFRPPLSQQIQTTVHLEIGRSEIPLEQWKETSPGDVVLLDRCTVAPGSNGGKVMLTIQGYPFFSGELEEGTIKLLENPLYHETEKSMTNRPPEEEEEDFQEESSEFPDEEEEEEDFEEESEEDFDEESEEEPEQETDEEEEEKAPPIKAELTKEKEFKGPPKPEQLTLPLVIEAGRMQMSIETLMQLKPGNILDLNVSPESGVDLVVNGSRIGKGELIQVGELLGVRVLELG